MTSQEVVDTTCWEGLNISGYEKLEENGEVQRQLEAHPKGNQGALGK